MQKYFISMEDFNNLRITGDDVFHIKNVMRSRTGDNIIVSNNISNYLVSIKEITQEYVSFEIVEEIVNNTELDVYVDIYQGYPKGDKLDDICKHSTELGVNQVYAVNMKRSIVKIDPKKIDTKIARFNKIMKEASEQSHRTRLATFGGIIDLKKTDFSSYDSLVLAFEETAKEGDLTQFKAQVKNLKKGQKMAIVIGPEGGIDMSEVDYLKSLGFVCCGLGKRILRTETASLYALSCISYESELK